MVEARRLRQLRAGLHLSQRELAEEWGVSPAAMAKWELGSNPLPGSVRKLLALYEAELAGTAPPPPPPTSIVARGFSGIGAFGAWVLLRRVFGVGGAFPSTPARDLLTRQLANRLSSSRGLLMKFGQAVGFLDPVLDPADREALSKIREGARAMSMTAVFRAFRAAFGTEPQRLFAEWSSRPLRCGSVGQVHRARTKDGRDVAVKIQYPGIRDAIEADLQLARMFEGWLSAFWPRQRKEVVFSELSARFLEECDYVHEARAATALRDAWRAEPRITIPEVIGEFTAGQILTTAWSPGKSWEHFLASRHDRVAAAETIWDYYIGSVYRHGMFNADPHPGNVLFERDRLAFVDFGRVKSLSLEFRRYFVELARAICERDWLRVFQLSVDAELIAPTGQPLDLARHCCWLWLPMLVDTIRITPAFCRASLEDLGRRSNRQTMSMSQDSVFLHHLTLSVYAMLAQLDVEADYRRRFLALIYPGGGAPPAFDRAELAMFGIDLARM